MIVGGLGVGGGTQTPCEEEAKQEKSVGNEKQDFKPQSYCLLFGGWQ